MLSIWLLTLGLFPAQQNDVRALMDASIAKQQESIARQRTAVAQHAPPAAAEPEQDQIEGDCGPLSELELRPILDRAAQKQGVAVDLLHAVIRQESALRPCATSAKGAMGLMQLMPETAAQFGVRDPFNPEDNVMAGAKFLKQLMEKYSGDLNRVLGAYNAGPARVDAYGGVPPIPETQNYVQSILETLQIQ
jgi:soluble lytic murein transglycosylase-like protein